MLYREACSFSQCEDTQAVVRRFAPSQKGGTLHANPHLLTRVSPAYPIHLMRVESHGSRHLSEVPRAFFDSFPMQKTCMVHSMHFLCVVLTF